MLKITVGSAVDAEWDKPLPEGFRGSRYIHLLLTEKQMEIVVLIDPDKDEDGDKLARHFNDIATALRIMAKRERGELPPITE